MGYMLDWYLISHAVRACIPVGPAWGTFNVLYEMGSPFPRVAFKLITKFFFHNHDLYANGITIMSAIRFHGWPILKIILMALRHPNKRRTKPLLAKKQVAPIGSPQTLTINSAAEFCWYDEHGRILKLRCGRLDCVRTSGFAIYINNAEIFSTTLEPGCGIAELMNLGVVNTWAQMVFHELFRQWEGLT